LVILESHKLVCDNLASIVSARRQIVNHALHETITPPLALGALVKLAQ
jgi:hypothetical protein